MHSAGDCSHWDNSIQRFCLGAFLLEDFQAGSTAHAVDYAFTTLREMYPPGYGWATRWSIVFDTATLRATFKTQRDPGVRWVDLEDFDLRCGKPPMMLGINEVTAGDVGDAFTEYDSDRNLAFKRAYYDQWGLAWDPDTERRLLEHLESFPCSQSRMSGARRVRPSGP